MNKIFSKFNEKALSLKSLISISSFKKKLNSKMNSLTNFIKKKRILIFCGVSAIFIFREKLLIRISNNYKLKKSLEALQERFDYPGSGKFQNRTIIDENQNLICTIFPTNFFDVNAVFSIANKFNITVMLDANDNQEDLYVPYIKLDMMNFNKIQTLDRENKVVRVEVGVKIGDLLLYLEKEGFTIPFIENLNNPNLTINDVIFNNFNGFSKGRFIDDYIENVEVAIPKEGGRLLQSKQNDDVTLSGINFKNIFLRTNSTFGIVLTAVFKITKKKHHNYLSAEGDFESCYNISNLLHNHKKEFGIKDIMILNSLDTTHQEGDNFQIVIKQSKESNEKCREFLDKQSLKFTRNTEVKDAIKITDDEDLIRKLKVSVPKKYFFKIFTTIFTKANHFKMKVVVKSSLVYNEIEIIIYNNHNTKTIHAYNFINSIHSSVLRCKGNIFINNHIKVNSKCFLMRDLGYENYILNEDIKAIFDPNFILNPHLSIIKPHPLKHLKRKNKYLNYLFSKIDL